MSRKGTNIICSCESFQNDLRIFAGAHFQFPTLKDFVLTEKENTAIKLPFRVELARGNCLDGTRFSLQVTRLISHNAVECSLLHLQGTCQEFSDMSPCSCPNQTGMYHLHYKLNRQDNPPVTWLWSSDSGVIQKRNVTFNVLYPPSVTTLSITTGRQDQCTLPCLVANQSSVEVRCAWDTGNPLVRATLLDRHRVEMKGNITSDGPLRQIFYRFAAVGCDDAALIRCQAPGAEQNQSATLLVKCPPVLDKDWRLVLENKSAFLLVNATSHTADFHQCNLTKINTSADVSSDREASNDQAPHTGEADNCLRSISVSGDLPHVTLKLRLDNSGDIRGPWHLALSNDAGAAQLDFQVEDAGESQLSVITTITATGRSTSQLHVSQETTVTTHTPSTELISTPSTLTYIATVVAVVVVVVVVSVSVSMSVCCVKRANVNNTRQAPMMMQGLAEEVFHWPDPPDTDSRSSSESDKSNNTYAEIPDGPESVNPVDLPGPPRRTRHCRAPRDVPDNYLNPVVPLQAKDSQSETSPQPPDIQQPLYQNCSSTPLNKT